MAVSQGKKGNQVVVQSTRPAISVVQICHWTPGGFLAELLS